VRLPAVLRVLTLSSLFPDVHRPNFGIFVERQTLGLAALEGIELQVVAPVGLPPFPLRLHPHFSGRGRLPSVESWKGLKVHRPAFPHLPGPGMRLAPLMMARRLLPLFRSIRADFPFDIIDTEYFWPDGPAAIALGRALNVPVSIKARGSDIHLWGKRGFSRRQLVEAGQAADGMLAVSAALKHDMTALGLPEEKIQVHYTGVDLDRFVIADRSIGKAALGLSGPLVLAVGYLIERKGQDIVVEAMRHLPEASLILIGDGPARPALEARIAQAGLESRVRLAGSVPHQDLPRWFAAADVSVLPSASEGLANVWVESLACGTPIVIADVGGAREVVDNPAAGRIVERSPHAVADAIRELLLSPAPRDATRQTATRFTWSANAEALAKHLSELVQRHQRGGDPAILAA